MEPTIIVALIVSSGTIITQIVISAVGNSGVQLTEVLQQRLHKINTAMQWIQYLAEANGILYCLGNTSNSHRLYKWNGVDTITECTDLSPSYGYSMISLNNEVYYCTANESTENAGKLYRYQNNVVGKRVNL